MTGRRSPRDSQPKMELCTKAALYSSKNNQAAQEKTVQLIRGHYTSVLAG